MPKWLLCVYRWARLHGFKEQVRDRFRYLYPSGSGQMPTRSMESMEPRLLMSATIEGSIFADGNRDAIKGDIEPTAYERKAYEQEQSALSHSSTVVSEKLSKDKIDKELKKKLGKEKGLGGWSVYIDENLDGQYTKGEQRTKTNARGEFEFTNLDEGFYDVGVEVADGWRLTEDVNPIQTVTLLSDSSTETVDFGVVQEVTAQVSVERVKAKKTGGQLTLSLESSTISKKADWLIDWGWRR